MTEKYYHDGKVPENIPLDESGSSLLKDVRENYLRLVYNVNNTRERLGIKYPVKISAATKTVPPSVINYAASLGLNCIGENRVQEFLDKEGYLDGSLERHFIGTLQRNKVKYITGKVSLIQSVDSVPLALEISKRAESTGNVQDILAEINIGRENGKGGFLPENLADSLDLISEFHGIRLCGVMTIAPHCSKKDDYRKFFAETYQILLDIAAKKMHNIEVPLLSMGMSDNYEIAIEYGANIIRPGTAIFGKRHYN
ncbi:MAG: YggS family pyridoxal phosphate-dependent enzyme [Clostridia bacterium]|nr:YggS family pyridoxal phosphate-dependent enzyme [Clostridia bacterium]